jgi:hypothetical protein|tara:strand:+ start:6442 stop:7134 length:693 start_codon:yes stop_codon:yes gene_type:complete
MEKDSKKSSVWQSTIKVSKTFLINFKKFFANFNPNVLQIIQLTFIYFFAVIDLIYAILNNVFSMGVIPELLIPVFPLIQSILQSSIFKIWGSPEKVFFLSYVVIEFMIVRSVFKFSKLVKYNILLIFAMLMVQGLVISYWDVLFHREIATPVAKWAYDQGALIHTDKTLAIVFFFNTFMLFIVTYFYLYLRAISGKFATIPGMAWLTDSVAFWLRIKTPTMRFGKRRKKK